MSAELSITAEIRDNGEILLTVEHGQADRVQCLQLTRAEMLAAIGTADMAMATERTAFTRYPQGLHASGSRS